MTEKVISEEAPANADSTLSNPEDKTEPKVIIEGSIPDSEKGVDPAADENNAKDETPTGETPKKRGRKPKETGSVEQNDLVDSDVTVVDEQWPIIVKNIGHEVFEYSTNTRLPTNVETTVNANSAQQKAFILNNFKQLNVLAGHKRFIVGGGE